MAQKSSIVSEKFYSIQCWVTNYKQLLAEVATDWMYDSAKQWKGHWKEAEYIKTVQLRTSSLPVSLGRKPHILPTTVAHAELGTRKGREPIHVLQKCLVILPPVLDAIYSFKLYVIRSIIKTYCILN